MFAEKKNMILKLTKADEWDLGKNIAVHLIELGENGKVIRLIDLNDKDEIIDASPTSHNLYGAEDHSPLDITCDWSSNEYPPKEFERLWGKVD